jgi:hypothetical protein
MATGTIVLPVQSAKIGGGFITNPARINGGGNAWSLLFATDQTESGLWQFRMPENYASGLIAKLQYSMASATSGKVDMEVEVMATSDGDSTDVDIASFDTVNEVSGGTTVPGTAGYLDEISISLTNDDSVAVGDLVYIRINRDHDDTDDTASGDLELRALSLEYTAS